MVRTIVQADEPRAYIKRHTHTHSKQPSRYDTMISMYNVSGMSGACKRLRKTPEQVLWIIMLGMHCGLLTDRQVNMRNEDKEERSLA